MLRILLCVPQTENLNVIPEIRELTSNHAVTVLNGPVSLNDVFQACKNEFDILHFGGHGDNKGFRLSATEQLSATDIAQLSRMSHARIVYLNACGMGEVAGRISRLIDIRNHKPRYIIYSPQPELKDKEAWQCPLTFYNELAQNGTKDESSVITAFLTADAEGTRYNMIISPNFLESILMELENLRKVQHAPQISITHSQLVTVILMTAAIMLIIFTIYALIALRAP